MPRFFARRSPDALMMINCRNFPLSGFGARLRLAARDADLAARIWLEALEPRLLFSRSVATLELDPTFGQGGIATVPAGPTRWPARILGAAADGRIYVLRTDANGEAILRYSPDGSPDPTFAGDGSLTVGSTYGTGPLEGQTQSWFEGRLIVQPDGKLLVCETGFTDGGDALVRTLHRFNEDGTPDLSFRTHGAWAVVLDRSVDPNFAATLWLQNDGSIVTVDYPSINPKASLKATMRRLNADGTPDESFGPNGTRYFGGIGAAMAGMYTEFVESSRVLPGGGAVAYLGMGDDNADIRKIVQVSFDGDDNLTSVRSVRTQDAFETIGAIEADGDLLIDYVPSDGLDRLARLRLDGTWDPAFGARGLTLPGSETSIEPQDEADGKILVGLIDYPESGGWVAGVERLNADGSPDLTFAGGQQAYSTDFRDYVYDSILLPDGSLIVATFVGDDASVPVLAKIRPSGGTPNTLVVEDQWSTPSSEGSEGVPPEETISVPSGDPLGGAALLMEGSGSPTPSAGHSIFATVVDSSLFDPEGTHADVLG
jgi:uncharacterized delta-60 repeat protein